MRVPSLGTPTLNHALQSVGHMAVHIFVQWRINILIILLTLSGQMCCQYGLTWTIVWAGSYCVTFYRVSQQHIVLVPSKYKHTVDIWSPVSVCAGELRPGSGPPPVCSVRSYPRSYQLQSVDSRASVRVSYEEILICCHVIPHRGRGHARVQHHGLHPGVQHQDRGELWGGVHQEGRIRDCCECVSQWQFGDENCNFWIICSVFSDFISEFSNSIHSSILIQDVDRRISASIDLHDDHHNPNHCNTSVFIWRVRSPLLQPGRSVQVHPWQLQLRSDHPREHRSWWKRLRPSAISAPIITDSSSSSVKSQANGNILPPTHWPQSCSWIISSDSGKLIF